MDEFFVYAMHVARGASSYTSVFRSQVITPLRQYATSQQDLMNIALLLVIVYLTLTILGMASRWIYAILISTVRMLMFVLVIGGGIWMWKRGLQKSQTDFWTLMEIASQWVNNGQATGTKGHSGFERGRYEY
jgi:undecaprenyl pyrophosphate phosphatase UppP